MCVHACVCVCACVRACVRVCVCMCVGMRAHTCKHLVMWKNNRVHKMECVTENSKIIFTRIVASVLSKPNLVLSSSCKATSE